MTRLAELVLTALTGLLDVYGKILGTKALIDRMRLIRVVFDIELDPLPEAIYTKRTYEVQNVKEGHHGNHTPYNQEKGHNDLIVNEFVVHVGSCNPTGEASALVCSKAAKTTRSGMENESVAKTPGHC